MNSVTRRCLNDFAETPRKLTPHYQQQMEQSTTHFSALPSNVFIHPGDAGSAARSSSGDDHRLQGGGPFSGAFSVYCNVANSVKGREPRGLQVSSGPGRPMPSPLVITVPPCERSASSTVGNPAKSVHRKIHRGTERKSGARAPSLSLSLSFSLCVSDDLGHSHATRTRQFLTCN